MSLRPEELTLIADEVERELTGGVVQKVHAPTPARLYFEVRVPGRSAMLLLCAEPKVARLSVVEHRPSNPPVPPAWQSVLRRELMGAKLIDAEALPTRKTLLLHFTKDSHPLTLVLEVTTAPVIVLCAADSKILAMSQPSRPGLRLGGIWAPHDEQAVKPLASRLMGDHVFLRLSHAAETLMGTVEQASWASALRAPLLSKLKKLERTQEKVRLEAERTDKALEYRREGELLTQNLHRVMRGMHAVTLTEYLEDGTTREIEVPLDPKRTVQQEVEWRFHQYKRMLRGAEIAKARLLILETQRAALQTQLDALGSSAAAPPSAPVRAKAVLQEALPPYREYKGQGGQLIWVGRGSENNDKLTFHLARPFHLWLHVRGLPGAHVVIPLEKNLPVPGEVLLDAATLAAHHSDAKGEPRVEVSYVPVKWVRKSKGAKPGAVSYTHEKTLLLRLEPARLERLLASAQQP